MVKLLKVIGILSIVAVFGIVAFVVLIKPTGSEVKAAQPDSTEAQNTYDSGAGTYWKTAGFDGLENEEGDFWSDLFLWKDGTGYFRFSQATPKSVYYGLHDVTSCDWSLENGKLTLYSSGTKAVLYSGSVADNVLTLHYDGYTAETITMQQAKMPPYGSHWTLLSLFGTWRMVSYTDATGYHAVEDLADKHFASEIIIDQVINSHYWWVSPLSGKSEMVHNMGIGYSDEDDDYRWHPLKEGPIWQGSVNEAWHVELTGDSTKVRLYATYADGQLLLKRMDNAKNFPSSFTAVYEYVGYRGELGEGDLVDIVNTRFGTVAYAALLEHYRDALNSGNDVETVADSIVDFLDKNIDIDNEQQLRALYYSIEEPLRGKSNIGYAIRDINLDGIPELFIIADDDTINSIFTLRNGGLVLVGAYWSRNSCMIDDYGTLYVNGSSGADDSSSASYSLNRGSGKLQLVKRFDTPYSPDLALKEAGLIFSPFTSAQAKGTINAGDSMFEQGASLFSTIVGYKEKTYSIYALPVMPNFAGVSGSAKFSPLPEIIGKNLESEDMYVYTFTIYQDKIYYIAAGAGSDIVDGGLYRCNLDGSRNERLADAQNYSTSMISDGLLYYGIYTDEGEHKIYAIDLKDMSRLEFSNFPENDEYGIYAYNGFLYYFSEGTLYKKNIETETSSVIMTLKAGPMNTYGDGSVISVVGDTVYYLTSGEYGDTGNVFLFGVSINGGDSALMASWFGA